MVLPIERNTMAGFSERTLKDLAFIYGARHHGADVHVVMQLIVSLLSSYFHGSTSKLSAGIIGNPDATTLCGRLAGLEHDARKN